MIKKKKLLNPKAGKKKRTTFIARNPTKHSTLIDSSGRKVATGSGIRQVIRKHYDERS